MYKSVKLKQFLKASPHIVLTVAGNVTDFTDELIEEGFVREIISRIQTMRKEAGFEVMDHICVYQKGSEELKAYMDKNKAIICEEVLADSMDLAVEQFPEGAYSKDWNINGFDTELAVKRV